ncbi:hypothetical protein QBB34_28935 [Streptomyces stelliscabiei]|uniref:hypothetical protein n=1 Tax=Streptomyces stelliscabiei TaxID=146820 RepID=UPI002FF0320D
MGRLAAAVHVQHPKSREWIVLEPGDEPDEDVAAEITNPDAWEDDEPSSEPKESAPEESSSDESQPFGFAAPPEAETEPAQPAPRRRRKTADSDA